MSFASPFSINGSAPVEEKIAESARPPAKADAIIAFPWSGMSRTDFTSKRYFSAISPRLYSSPVPRCVRANVCPAMSLGAVRPAA